MRRYLQSALEHPSDEVRLAAVRTAAQLVVSQPGQSEPFFSLIDTRYLLEELFLYLQFNDAALRLAVIALFRAFFSTCGVQGAPLEQTHAKSFFFAPLLADVVPFFDDDRLFSRLIINRENDALLGSSSSTE